MYSRKIQGWITEHCLIVVVSELGVVSQMMIVATGVKLIADTKFCIYLMNYLLVILNNTRKVPTGKAEFKITQICLIVCKNN